MSSFNLDSKLLPVRYRGWAAEYYRNIALGDVYNIHQRWNSPDSHWEDSLRFHDLRLIQDKEKNMKIVFYYDNGKTFTATKVSSYEKGWGNITYTTRKKVGNVSIKQEVTVPLNDVIAYTVIDSETTTTKKLKPCAVVSSEVKKK